VLTREVRVEQTTAPKASVGIDLGIKDVAVTSDGERLEAIRFYRDAQHRIGALQRRGHLRQAKRLHRRIRRRRSETKVHTRRGTASEPDGQ